MNKNNKKANKKNSNSKFISLLLGILAISLIIGIIIISIIQKNSPSSYFIQETAVSSEKVYNKLLDLTEENYPNSPEKVVKLYVETYKLTFGNRISPKAIDEVLPIILEKQRILFSNQLNEDNPINEQLISVKKHIKFLEDNKLKITSSEVLPTIYDQKNSNLAYVNVKFQDNTLESENGSSFKTYYYKYYLERNSNGKWHITGFYLTDSNFNIIK